MNRTQKILTGVVVSAVLVIATLGFIGSYSAVTRLAALKGFGEFAHAFPIAVDAGIIAFLALDLLLTWRRIAFPLLRYTAWGLTAATIAFNAVAAWPDPIGTSMHGTIPILFVIAVEAARHAIGRIADITADKHMEGPNASRWLLNPIGTFVLWRRQRLWGIRLWDTVLELERERRIYIAQLRRTYGRWGWRRKASADQMLVLSLAKDGMSIQDAIELPEREARKLAEAEEKRAAEARAQAEAEAEAKHQTELRKAEVEAKRRAEIAEAEAAEARARAEAEAAAEALRLEAEANQRREAEAARLLVAETEAKLAEIARAQREAEAEAELNQQRRAAEQSRLQAEAARQAREQAAADAQRLREEQARERAQRIAAQATTASTSASGTSGSAAKTARASGSASTSVSPITGPRAKKQSEVAEVLARMVEADDPEAVSLKWIQEHFDLKQTTAYDRLVTAQNLFAEARAPKSETA
jgi:hypothetical protein